MCVGGGGEEGKGGSVVATRPEKFLTEALALKESLLRSLHEVDPFLMTHFCLRLVCHLCLIVLAFLSIHSRLRQFLIRF